MRNRILIAGALVASLAVAGCGGAATNTTGSTANPAATTVTKEAFVARANEICGRADPELAAAEQQLANHPSTAKVIALVRGTFVPSVESQTAQIKALGTPQGGQQEVATMLTLIEADLQKLKTNPALIATNVFGNFARVAHAYGLTACAPLS
jgi:hypothetical protein